jgi:predicted nucleotidyltransferase component of viral defense system
MFTNTLSPNTLRGIKLIGNEKWLDFAYLAGGTALALRLGHRQSIDLDFFTPDKFDEQIILAKLQKTGQYKIQQTAWQTVKGRLFQVSFSLFYYNYPTLDKTDDFLGIRVASLKDISAMKINAVEGRGSKRDFIDLYFLSQNFSLEEMLEFYDQKYRCLKDHKYNILKSLNYFEDAENEDPPKMIKEIDWDKIKDFFQKESKRLSLNLI